MGKTVEQKGADDALDVAIREVVGAYGLLDDESIIVDYVIAIEGLSTTEESGMSFGVAFKDGRMRTTTAIGILTLALEQMGVNNVR